MTYEEMALEKVKQIIIKALREYPGITKSMLSTKAQPGAAQKGISWQKAFDELLDEGRIVYVKTIRDGNAALDLYLAEHVPGEYAAHHAPQPTH